MIPKFCPFRSICDRYRDKRPLPVFKVKGHQVTYLNLFCYMTLNRANYPKIVSVSLYLQRWLRSALFFNFYFFLNWKKLKFFKFLSSNPWVKCMWSQIFIRSSQSLTVCEISTFFFFFFLNFSIFLSSYPIWCMWSQIFVRFALSLTVFEISTKNVIWVIGYLAIGQTIGRQMVSFGQIKNVIHRCRSPYTRLNSGQIPTPCGWKLTFY